MTGEGDKFIKKITEGAVKALTQAAFTEDGGIVLFFRPSGKEYFYEKGLGIWRPVKFGTHLVAIFNAYISKDYAKLKRFTGEDDQELAYERAGVLGRFAWGLIGYKRNPLPAHFPEPKSEKILIAWKMLSVDSVVKPILHPKFGWGWFAVAETPFKAAFIETAIAYTHRWRGKIRLCQWCQQLFYGSSCRGCRKERGDERKERVGFRNLLYQHKHKAGKQGAEDAVKAIDRCLRDLREGKPIGAVFTAHARTCKRFNLPEAWLKYYNVSSKES